MLRASIEIRLRPTRFAPPNEISVTSKTRFVPPDLCSPPSHSSPEYVGVVCFYRRHYRYHCRCRTCYGYGYVTVTDSISVTVTRTAYRDRYCCRLSLPLLAPPRLTLCNDVSHCNTDITGIDIYRYLCSLPLPFPLPAVITVFAGNMVGLGFL